MSHILSSLILTVTIIFMDSETREKIGEIIFYFIHAVPRLKYLFLRWCRLTPEDKYYLDEEVLNALSIKGKLLYAPLREAFVQWDILQDTQGAPGFQPGCHEYKCDSEVEEEITKVVNALDVSLDNLYYKKDFDTQEEGIFEWTKVSIPNRPDYPCIRKIKRSKSLNDLSKNSSCSAKKNQHHNKMRHLTNSRSNVVTAVYESNVLY